MILPEPLQYVRFLASSSRWNLSLEDRDVLLAVVAPYEEMFSLTREAADYVRLADTGSFPDQANTAQLLAEMEEAIGRGLGREGQTQGG